MRTWWKHVVSVWRTTLDWRTPYMLVIVVAFYWIFAHSLRHPSYSLDAVVRQLMGPLIWMSVFYYHWIFKSGMMKSGCDDAAQGGWGSVEFFFSRAVSRRAVFAVRMGLFLLILILPWIGYLACASVHPTLELERHGAGDQGALQFYLAHFSGAIWKADLVYPHEGVLTLPNGAFYVVGGAGVIYLTGALLYQLVMEVVRRKGLQIAITVGLFLLYIGLPFLGLRWKSWASPSFTERAVAWIAVHPMWVYPGLMALTVGIQWFCCRRFVRKEIL